MPRTLLAFAMAGLGSLFATGLSGQVPEPLAPGQAVRITDGTGHHRTGVILSISSDSQAIEIKDRLGRWTYDVADVSTIEEKTGTYTSARTILVTMGVTVLAGALIGAATYKPCQPRCYIGPESSLEASLWGAAEGAFFVGIPLGTVLWPIIRYSQWEMVATPSSHPRVGLGLTFKVPMPSW